MKDLEIEPYYNNENNEDDQENIKPNINNPIPAIKKSNLKKRNKNKINNNSSESSSDIEDED